jgi:hypothetical protein
VGRTAGERGPGCGIGGITTLRCGAGTTVVPADRDALTRVVVDATTVVREAALGGSAAGRTEVIWAARTGATVTRGGALGGVAAGRRVAADTVARGVVTGAGRAVVVLARGGVLGSSAVGLAATFGRSADGERTDVPAGTGAVTALRDVAGELLREGACATGAARVVAAGAAWRAGAGFAPVLRDAAGAADRVALEEDFDDELRRIWDLPAGRRVKSRCALPETLGNRRPSQTGEIR